MKSTGDDGPVAGQEDRPSGMTLCQCSEHFKGSQLGGAKGLSALWDKVVIVPLGTQNLPLSIGRSAILCSR